MRLVRRALFRQIECFLITNGCESAHISLPAVRLNFGVVKVWASMPSEEDYECFKNHQFGRSFGINLCLCHGTASRFGETNGQARSDHQRPVEFGKNDV